MGVIPVIFLLLYLPIELASKKDGFDSVWILGSNKKLYLINHKPLAWYDANHECQQRSSKLLTIANKSTQDVVDFIIESKNPSLFWSGLTEDLFHHWSWESGIGEPEYVNWAPGQPYQENGLPGCGLINGNGFWQVSDCEVERLSICEKPDDGSANTRDQFRELRTTTKYLHIINDEEKKTAPKHSVRKRPTTLPQRSPLTSRKNSNFSFLYNSTMLLHKLRTYLNESKNEVRNHYTGLGRPTSVIRLLADEPTALAHKRGIVKSSFVQNAFSKSNIGHRPSLKKHTGQSYMRDFINDIVVKTTGGNGHGKPCVFPFISNGKTNFRCIHRSSTILRDRKWCAVTSNFDRDMQWGFCIFDDDMEEYTKPAVSLEKTSKDLKNISEETQGDKAERLASALVNIVAHSPMKEAPSTVQPSVTPSKIHPSVKTTKEPLLFKPNTEPTKLQPLKQWMSSTLADSDLVNSFNQTTEYTKDINGHDRVRIKVVKYVSTSKPFLDSGKSSGKFVKEYSKIVRAPSESDSTKLDNYLMNVKIELTKNPDPTNVPTSKIAKKEDQSDVDKDLDKNAEKEHNLYEESFKNLDLNIGKSFKTHDPTKSPTSKKSKKEDQNVLDVKKEDQKEIDVKKEDQKEVDVKKEDQNSEELLQKEHHTYEDTLRNLNLSINKTFKNEDESSEKPIKIKVHDRGEALRDIDHGSGDSTKNADHGSGESHRKLREETLGSKEERKISELLKLADPSLKLDETDMDHSVFSEQNSHFKKPRDEPQQKHGKLFIEESSDKKKKITSADEPSNSTMKLEVISRDNKHGNEEAHTFNKSDKIELSYSRNVSLKTKRNESKHFNVTTDVDQLHSRPNGHSNSDFNNLVGHILHQIKDVSTSEESGEVFGHDSDLYDLINQPTYKQSVLQTKGVKGVPMKSIDQLEDAIAGRRRHPHKIAKPSQYVFSSDVQEYLPSKSGNVDFGQVMDEVVRHDSSHTHMLIGGDGETENELHKTTKLEGSGSTRTEKLKEALRHFKDNLMSVKNSQLLEADHHVTPIIENITSNGPRKWISTLEVMSKDGNPDVKPGVVEQREIDNNIFEGEEVGGKKDRTDFSRNKASSVIHEERDATEKIVVHNDTEMKKVETYKMKLGGVETEDTSENQLPMKEKPKTSTPTTRTGTSSHPPPQLMNDDKITNEMFNPSNRSVNKNSTEEGFSNEIAKFVEKIEHSSENFETLKIKSSQDSTADKPTFSPPQKSKEAAIELSGIINETRNQRQFDEIFRQAHPDVAEIYREAHPNDKDTMQPTRRHVERKTFGGNANKGSCVFPFVYDGQSYWDCVRLKRPLPWCSTTSNYDVMPKWGYCCTEGECPGDDSKRGLRGNTTAVGGKITHPTVRRSSTKPKSTVTVKFHQTQVDNKNEAQNRNIHIAKEAKQKDASDVLVNSRPEHPTREDSEDGSERAEIREGAERSHHESEIFFADGRDAQREHVIRGNSKEKIERVQNRYDIDGIGDQYNRHSFDDYFDLPEQEIEMNEVKEGSILTDQEQLGDKRTLSRNGRVVVEKNLLYPQIKFVAYNQSRVASSEKYSTSEENITKNAKKKVLSKTPARQENKLTKNRSEFNDSAKKWATDSNSITANRKTLTAQPRVYIGDSTRSKCEIQFVYNGVTHVRCVAKHDGRAWCATMHNYKRDSKWTRCS